MDVGEHITVHGEGPTTSRPVTANQVAALLRRAQLSPEQWNLDAITRKTNTWITDNLNELSHMGTGWTPEDRAAHLAEFGSLTAVDFIEQCVIEAGPDTAPWQDLQRRADAGEFETWPPIWDVERSD